MSEGLTNRGFIVNTYMAVPKKPMAVITSSAVVGSLMLTGTAFAQTQPAPTVPQGQGGWGRGGQMMRRAPGVLGTVSAISGTTLTVSAKMGPPGQNQNASPTTYTVDASAAVVTKNGAASTLAAIAVGDTIMAQGTLSGTTLTATAIRDGMLKGMPGMRPPEGAMLQGNGQPVVGGTVSAISGNTLTLGTKAGTSYSVDASAATVIKQGATSTLAAIAAGDAVVVQGAVNGTAITASSILDQGTPKPSTDSMGMHLEPGFLGMIGGFFQHLFGFF